MRAPRQGPEGEIHLSTVDSLVERAGSSLGRAVQILVVGLAVAALLVFFLIGNEGREAVREGLTHGLATKMGVAHHEDDGPFVAPPPAESPVVVPVKMRLDGEESVQREFDFSSDTSGEMLWYLYRGYWRVVDGALVQDVFRGGAGVDRPQRIPRAFLGRERYFADGFRIEASVKIDTTPGPEVPADRATKLMVELEDLGEETPPLAKLYLYRNVRHFFSLEIVGGDAGVYRVRWNLGDGERFGAFEGGSDLPEPDGPRPLRVALWIEAGWIYASVNDQEIGRGEVGDLDLENWGKAGFGCQAARCTFDDVLIAGRTRPPPTKAERVGTSLTVEPVER